LVSFVQIFSASFWTEMQPAISESNQALPLFFNSDNQIEEIAKLISQSRNGMT
jgi:hypothetical protein